MIRISNEFPTASPWPAPSIRAGFARTLAAAAALPALWLHRARSRRALLRLSERELRDVGLSAEAARREAALPFWR
jgi:uncharacterized protein YjiS (DUF1127 family)